MKKLNAKEMRIFYSGILLGVLFILFAVLLFQEISFFIGGVGIMIIGFSFLYYLSKWKKK